MIIRRGWGWGEWRGVSTFLTSTSFTLGKMHALHMLSNDHQEGWGWGVGGCMNVLDDHFLGVTEDAHVAHAEVTGTDLLRWVPRSSVLTADGARGFAASCDKDYPHKRFKMAQVNHKQNTFTKTYHFRCCLWGKSYTTIVAGTQQMDGTWNHLKKLRPPSVLHKKKQNVYKKRVHLGLQLDMASQCCLVADCGCCFATSALAPLASRRGKNWKSECRADMIRMIENHQFLMLFFWPLKSKIESPRRRNTHFHSWVTRLPIEMNVHIANISWRLLQIPAFCLLPSKIRISISSPLQGRRVNRLPSFLRFAERIAASLLETPGCPPRALAPHR